MIILPAIDIKDGCCVRLYKGDYSTAEKVAENPVDTARAFREDGAEWLHMVDLDGAKDASQQNAELILDTAKEMRAAGMKTQAGGGIRGMRAIERYLSGGVERVILGSAAVKKPALVKEAAQEYKGRIAVALDAKRGFVMTEGWLQRSEVHYLDLALEMCRAGVEYFIFTDIDKDGTLSRPNYVDTKKLHAALSPLGGKVIASGGIRSISNIETLCKSGIYGAVCGKSLYHKTLDLKEAVKLGNKYAG